jgi:hypothetical protein
MIRKTGLSITNVLGLGSPKLASQNVGGGHVAPQKLEDLPATSLAAGVVAVQDGPGAPIMREDFVTFTGPMTSHC